METFDKSSYKGILGKRIKELKQFCTLEGIPMFITFALENTDEGTAYLSDMINPDLINVDLKDNKINEMVKVLNGFDVVPKNTPLEIDMDSLPPVENGEIDAE